MGGTKNYGADSEAGRYLVNHDGACDYGDIGDPSEIESYKVPAEDNIKRQYQGREPRTFKQFRDKMKGMEPKLAS